MALRIPGSWIWDFWHARDGDLHHLFYLQSPRSSQNAEDRHWSVSVGHATSRDLRSWNILPDALSPSPQPAWDDLTTWTGSVLRHDGIWWMFYTGTSRADRGLIQRVGLAVSDDLTMWHRRGAGPLIEADPRWYELLDPVSWPEQAWRDPWVFGAEDGTFHALLTARAATGDAPTRGVVGHAVSHDLVSWQVRPPVTEPGMFGHLEIPQVVWIADRWWLLFSTSAATAPDAPAAARTAGTHALNSTRGPTGPFDWSTHQLLDGDALRSWYGGRIVTDLAGRPQFLAWRQHDDRGCFVGEIGDPVPVGVEAGRLVVRR